MLRAPGPARKTTAAATSCGSTWRRSAAPAAMRADTSSALSPVRVAMDSIMALSGSPVVKPGVTTLTRTLAGPSSLARVRDAVTIACFVAV